MTAFIFYLAALGAILSLSLLLPILVAFGFQEIEVGYRLINYASMGAFLSVATLLAVRGYAGRLGRLAGIYLCITAWIGLPLLLALPFSDILQLSFIDGYFEATSGFTTTGATIVRSIDNIPKSMVVARAQLQWLGGLATLITIILILAPSRIGGLPQHGQSSVAASVLSSSSNLAAFCWRLTRVYLAISLTCFSLLLITGSPPFDALVLAMTAISSGGFLPSDRSLDATVSQSGLAVMTLFLLIAATSIFWHRMLVRLNVEELQRHRESYFILATWVIVGFVLSYLIFRAAGSASGFRYSSATSEGFFNAASMISTSGLQSRSGIYALLPATVVLGLMFLGAGCFSTASGIKFFRLGAMLSQSVHELNLLIYPHGIRPRHIGSLTYDIQMMKAIWGLVVAAIVVVIFGAIMLSYYGMNFQAGFTASIASFVNAGPAYGPEWAPQSELGWPSYSDMIYQQKVILCGLMIIGRLEVVLVFAALNFAFWFNR